MPLLAWSVEQVRPVKGFAVPTQKPQHRRQSNEVKAEPKEPHSIYQAACPVLLDNLITAKRLPPLKEGQCGERSPLSVLAIGGVPLSLTVTLNCRIATEMVGWVAEAEKAALKHLGTELTRLQTSTSYQCRRRNNAPTGKISEHGFANAIDIIGFELANGKIITVLDHWQMKSVEPIEETEDQLLEPSTPEGDFLLAIRDAACTRFTTVLSPEANRLHADHFHFDLGCHGKNCRYRICE